MNINSSFNMNSVMTTDINITLIETTFFVSNLYINYEISYNKTGLHHNQLI